MIICVIPLQMYKTKWFKDHDIELLEQLANIPNLNPIENLKYYENKYCTNEKNDHKLFAPMKIMMTNHLKVIKTI